MAPSFQEKESAPKKHTSERHNSSSDLSSIGEHDKSSRGTPRSDSGPRPEKAQDTAPGPGPPRSSTAARRRTPGDEEQGAEDEREEEEEEDDTALGRLASVTRTCSRSRSHSNLPPPPDGGLRAWSQVLAGWLVIFATWGYMNSFGTFQSYYETTALPHQPPSSISWIGSIQACLTTAIGAFTGRLLDAGFFRPTFAVGAVLQLAGIFATGASDSPRYWHLMLAQGVLSGLGGGILFTPSLALVATWFGRRRGLAIGLATTGNSAGGIVYPLIVQQLIPRVGFAWTARVLGFVNLACFGAALALLRSRLPPRRSGPLIDWSAFREGVYVTYVVGLFFFIWANYYVFYYIASYGIHTLGLSYSSASTLVIIVNGAGLPARVLVPMLADRIGPLNVISVSTLLVAVVLFCWFAVANVPGFYAFTAVLGLVSGAVQSLMPSTVASITKRLDTVGTRLGMCFSVISVASLTGPPVGGALQSASGGSFVGAQAWAAVSALTGAAFLLGSRWLKAGWELKSRC